MSISAAYAALDAVLRQSAGTSDKHQEPRMFPCHKKHPHHNAECRLMLAALQGSAVGLMSLMYT